MQGKCVTVILPQKNVVSGTFVDYCSLPTERYI